MFTSYRLALPAVLACLLQACGAPPARQDWTVQPLAAGRNAACQSAAACYQLGKYHQERGQFALAASDYEASIALDAHQADARNALAALLSAQGKRTQAIALLRQVVAEHPRLAYPYNNLGYACYLQGDFAAAEDALRQALALEPHNERARNNLQLALAGAAGKPVAAPVPPAVAPAPAMPQPRMELVQLAPNIFQLAARALPATATALPASQPLAQADARIRMEIINGNGMPGLGARVRRLLGKNGITASRLANQHQFRQRQTIIQYRPGKEAQAQALLLALHGNALLLPFKPSAGSYELRLVLGKDISRHLALLEATAHGARLAAN